MIALGLALVVAVAAAVGASRRWRKPVALVLGVVVFVVAFGLIAGRQRSSDASVRFSGPGDDTTVSNPVTIQVVVERAQLSHPHVMLDEPCLDEGEVIPADSAHLHLGGERKWTLDLPPGSHTLCAQMGDRQHRAAPADDRVTFVVK